MNKPLSRLAALALTLTLTACGGAPADTTASPETTAAPIETTAAPETTIDPNAPTFSEALTGYYTCGNASLELFHLGGVQYGELCVTAADGTANYSGLRIEPVNPGEFDTKGLTETRVRIVRFSAEDLGGSLIGDPAAYTLAVTAGGIELCDHSSGTALIEENDVDLVFTRTDAPAPAASPLTFDAEAAKAAGVIGAWNSVFVSGNLTYDVTLTFRENGRMFARIEVDGQVPNIWIGDYAIPTAADKLPAGTIICSVTRKGAVKQPWTVYVSAPARNNYLYMQGVKDPSGATLLGLSCVLSPIGDKAVIPTLE